MRGIAIAAAGTAVLCGALAVLGSVPGASASPATGIAAQAKTYDATITVDTGAKTSGGLYSHSIGLSFESGAIARHISV